MLLIFTESKNFEKLKEILTKDEIVSRASIKYRSAKDFGKDGYYILISGNEEQCKRAREISKEFGEEVENKEEVMKKFKEEEKKALEGFGSIFS